MLKQGQLIGPRLELNQEKSTCRGQVCAGLVSVVAGHVS
jgi:hypothetical protein